jgi:hypothetical protein
VKIISEIKDLLDRISVGSDINPKEGISPESVYESLCSVIPSQPPRKLSEGEPVFKNWKDLLDYKTKLVSGLVYKMLPLHDALERSTLEYLFKVEDKCFALNHDFRNVVYGERYSHVFTELMYCMVGLANGLDDKYKHTRAINSYRSRVELLKNPFPHAYDYKYKYDEPEPLTYNTNFLLQVTIFVIMVAFIIAVFF